MYSCKFPHIFQSASQALGVELEKVCHCLVLHFSVFLKEVFVFLGGWLSPISLLKEERTQQQTTSILVNLSEPLDSASPEMIQIFLASNCHPLQRAF